MKAGIYIHIPFCRSKCAYCDFLSFAHSHIHQRAYVDALIREIESYDAALSAVEVTSIYIGGGTPTTLPSSFLCTILQTLTKYRLSQDAEITIEANPGTLNQELLEALYRSGVNRLSIGLQARQNHLLQKLGRIHTWEEFLESYQMARDAGFENVNVDIMFSLPDQSEADFQETVKEVVAREPAHISAYGLIVEEGSVFGQMREALTLPDEESDRSMYHGLCRYLRENNYRQYEISNFARPGYCARHNLLYWQRGTYFGFGLGAASLIDNTRYRNTEDLQAYLETGGRHKYEITHLNQKDEMEETMFLGLRMNAGVRDADFADKFGYHICDVYGDTVRKFIAHGLLRWEQGSLRLTERGFDLANTVFCEFLL